MTDFVALCDDLEAEAADLDAIVTGLAVEQWDAPTAAPGWTVRDQIAHLAMSDELAAVAAEDRESFGRRLAEMMADLDAVRRENTRMASASPKELLGSWRRERTRLLEALRRHVGSDRILWAAGEMSAPTFVSARLMENWAHGHDIVEGFGWERPATTRLRHIADLGLRTRRFAFVNRGLEPPTGDVYALLSGPDDTRWDWGDPACGERVSGSALDFCLVVTQRRDVAETELKIEGDHANAWMAIAQAFAGPPTTTTRRTS